MKKRYAKTKYIPTFYGFNDYEKKDFYCYWEVGVYDKYGLYYTINFTNETEDVHLKGKKYGKPPYAFNSYKEMMEKMEQFAKDRATATSLGDIRRKAVYLILDLDEDGNLRSDPCDFDGFVSKRGTVFNITGDGAYDGKKRFELTDKNKHLVFPGIAKAATYVRENYGRWAASHYLKSHPANY
ncbi:MAG: hypothetical protein UHN47_03845 [Lachnospiraceae bacterium]|nr:hypothetical protein [Lachnospiraceae bacterium]